MGLVWGYTGKLGALQVLIGSPLDCRGWHHTTGLTVAQQLEPVPPLKKRLLGRREKAEDGCVGGVNRRKQEKMRDNRGFQGQERRKWDALCKSLEVSACIFIFMICQ